GRQALVRVLGVVLAPVAESTWHQRWKHQLRSNADGLAHKIGLQLGADLDNNAGELMAKGERPRQWFRPVALQNVLIGATNAARCNLNERPFGRDLGPRHFPDHGVSARTVECRYADRFSRPSARCHAFLPSENFACRLISLWLGISFLDGLVQTDVRRLNHS